MPDFESRIQFLTKYVLNVIAPSLLASRSQWLEWFLIRVRLHNVSKSSPACKNIILLQNEKMAFQRPSER